MDSPDGENPAGYDGGPAEVGYGDMITLDGVTWDPISNYGFDLNWNLHANISALTDNLTDDAYVNDLSIYSGPSQQLLAPSGDAAYEPVGLSKKDIPGYHIYHSINGSGYEFIGRTLDSTYLHIAEIEFHPWDLNCYYVKVVYEDCEANSNEACVIYSGMDDLNSVYEILVYPNPASEIINIESQYTMQNICLLDLSGRIIYCEEGLNEKKTSIDVSGYEPGVYLLRIDTEQGRLVRKIVINE